MALIESAADREMDPLQSVLMHLPGGMYGAYQALCDYIAIDLTVPENVKEGLRFLSASRIGCAFCVTVRLPGAAGERLLADAFYEAITDHDVDWDVVAPDGWGDVFRMAEEVLSDGVISDGTGMKLRERHSDPEIVESLFYLHLIGASHRFSKSLGIEEACAVPTRLAPARSETSLSPSSLGS